MKREEALEGINDKLKDLKYYAKEMGEVLKSTNYFIDELEKQIKEVEQKPKAYHVTDKYSYDCLMKELEERGYLFWAKFYGATKPTRVSYNIAYGTRDYIYLLDGKDIGWSSEEHTSTPQKYEDKEYEVIEYKKEPPKFYAKRKGWEVFESDFGQYWNYVTVNGKLMTSTKKRIDATISIMTKEEWAKLGITEENADFERWNDDDTP